MKKSILYSIILLSTISSLAQFPMEAFKSSELTWFGIDYTNVKMIGDGFNDPKALVDSYFHTWNVFVIREPRKYDVGRYLQRPDLDIDVDIVKERNSMVDYESIRASNRKQLNKVELQETLNAYTFPEKKGLGAMLVAEYYDKRRGEASYQFIIFDVRSKRILFNKIYISGAGGGGFTYYWARTFYVTLRSIEKDLKKWLN